MTLPQELRNRIYDYVFADSITYAREPIKYDWEVKAELNTETAYVPARIRLDETAPPTKDALLPCRQLYSEMKEMQATAFREYWSTNRFIYSVAEMGPAVGGKRPVPAQVKMQHIHHFSLLIKDDYFLDIVLAGGLWESRLLPTHGRALGFGDMGIWLISQGETSDEVRENLISFAKSPTRCTLDPRTGQGLTERMLRTISLDDEIIESIDSMHSFFEEARVSGEGGETSD